MKKALLLLLLFSLLGATTISIPTIMNAQEAVTEAWVALYNGPENSLDSPSAMAIDGQGNVYVTGLSLSPNNTLYYLTIKYDSSGDQLWAARSQVAPPSGANAIAIDTEGNVYVAGGPATVKYDSNGNLLWESPPAHWGWLGGGGSAIALDNAGHLYVAGGRQVLKYDCNGDQTGWPIRYTSFPQGAVALVLDGANNVCVTGSEGNGVSNDYVTVKYDSNLNQLWVAGYDGPAHWNDEARGIAVDGSGSVYVTGASCGGGADTDHYDYATIKYDSNGNQLWLERYDGVASLRDEPFAMAMDRQGNIYVTGYSESYGSSAGLTIKYDSNGNQLWVARHPAENAEAIAVDASGNVYVTDGGGVDWVTVKYDTNGNELWVVRSLGGGLGPEPHAIAVDGQNVYVTGTSASMGNAIDCATVKYVPATPNTPGGGGCFIATAAYGTPMAEDIQVLREFRDRYLITNPVGEKLVSTYYRVSPPMADYIVEHPSLKPLVRFALQPAIVFSSVAINTTPMEKIAIALVILTLLFVMRERKGQRKAR